MPLIPWWGYWLLGQRLQVRDDAQLWGRPWWFGRWRPMKVVKQPMAFAFSDDPIWEKHEKATSITR